MTSSEVTHRDSTKLRDDVQHELRTLFARHTASANEFGPDFALLWNLSAEQIHGGKLVRPLLFLQAYDAFLSASQTPALADHADVTRIATAIEALHFAFLLHDDVIDADTFRRGRANLIGELMRRAPQDVFPGASSHWAQAGGILAGNLLLSAAHQLIARISVPHEERIRLLDLLDQTILATTAGEFTDVGLSDGVIPPDLATILTMTGRKTAVYSFELPLRAAAILAGASPAADAPLTHAALRLGTVYQLQDDLLSTLGDATVHGKDPYSDLREGKETALIGYARLSDAWASVEPDFGDPLLSPERAEELRTLIRTSGAERFVRGIIREELHCLREALTKAHDLPLAVRELVFDLASRIDGRSS